MVTMSAMVIGPAHRLEGFDDLADISPEPGKHVTNDMIALDENAVCLDLGGEMPVAEMPGKLDQMQRIARADLEQPFLGCLDLDRGAIIEEQPVAMMKKHGLLQVEHDHLAIVEMQELASEMAPIMRKDHNPLWRIRDRTGGFERGRTLHENSGMAVF
jgi:hypothetical protein